MKLFLMTLQDLQILDSQSKLKNICNNIKKIKKREAKMLLVFYG
ncbi:hypothetical protein E27107_50036 [Elizabethkingia anophelis]|nr:hypothetical protein E27107_50036 [Elizabethkingia anophelis]